MIQQAALVPADADPYRDSPEPPPGGPASATAGSLGRRRFVLGTAAVGAGALGLVGGLARAFGATKKQIVWSKDRQRVYLVQDGRVVRTMVCLGNVSKTPNGTYHLWSWGLTYGFYRGRKVWLQNFAPFYRRPGASANIGLHRVPIWAGNPHAGQQIHPDSDLGDGTQTEGCIRLSDADIKATRAFAPVGTAVVVQNGAYVGHGAVRPPHRPAPKPGPKKAPPYPAGLSPNHRSPSAVGLQRQLKKAHFMPASVQENPNYGPATQRAVAAFNDAHPQFRTGPKGKDVRIGPSGWAYLFTHY